MYTDVLCLLYIVYDIIIYNIIILLSTFYRYVDKLLINNIIQENIPKPSVTIVVMTNDIHIPIIGKSSVQHNIVELCGVNNTICHQRIYNYL